eukprot:336365-Prorocentrum_minimum.AAC.3
MGRSAGARSADRPDSARSSVGGASRDRPESASSLGSNPSEYSRGLSSPAVAKRLASGIPVTSGRPTSAGPARPPRPLSGSRSVRPLSAGPRGRPGEIDDGPGDGRSGRPSSARVSAVASFKEEVLEEMEETIEAEESFDVSEIVPESGEELGGAGYPVRAPTSARGGESERKGNRRSVRISGVVDPGDPGRERTGDPGKEPGGAGKGADAAAASASSAKEKRSPLGCRKRVQLKRKKGKNINNGERAPLRSSPPRVIPSYCSLVVFLRRSSCGGPGGCRLAERERAGSGPWVEERESDER